MSRTKQDSDKPKNPSTMFLEWDSEGAQWKYWNKEAEQQMHVPLNTPFIVLDQLSTVKGYNEPQKCGVWSNEVKQLSSPFTVRNKHGVVAQGLWKEIKEKLGYAKFTTSLYAMARIGEEYKLVNFQLSGCSLGPWIDFVKESGGIQALYGDIVIAATGAEHMKKGRVEFDSPTFGIVSRKLSEDASKQADELDNVLQAYLEQYFAGQKLDEEDAIEPQAEPVTATYEAKHEAPAYEGDDLPF
jgi:hypothetical protein